MIKLKPGTKIASENNLKVFIVDSLLHTGSGQGDIYKVHSDHDVYALKLFHTGNQKRLRNQIAVLQRRGQASDAFVHPLYVVEVEGHIGYVMEFVNDGPKGQYMDGSVLCNGVECTLNGNTLRVELPFNEKLKILYNIAEAVKVIFKAGIALMDLKFENIKINKSNLSVKILDTDTAVGRESKAIVSGTIGFMPPLTMRGEEAPNIYNDAYALAVMIYMTLIGGHPLRGKRYEEPCTGDIDTYTFATNPIYTYNRKDTSNRPLESEYRVIQRMKNYPGYFKDAMHQTFVEGLFEGAHRVEPQEWQDILLKLYADHFLCPVCGEEIFFSSINRRCYVCDAEIHPPIRLLCEGSSEPGVYLFNGNEISTEELWDDENSFVLFKVVVSRYDKKYGLKCMSTQRVELELANGILKIFGKEDVIPIFLDSKIKVGKYNLSFLGGV